MKIPCLLGFAASLALASPPVPPDPGEAAYPAVERFIEVLEAVRKRHPDVDRLAYERLVNHALEGMLAGLDPHSSFIHPEMMRQMQDHEDLDPEIASLGLTLGIRDDGPYVAATTPGGSAAEAGVMAGGSILEIDGKEPGGANLPELLKALQRAPGESSKLSLKSVGQPLPDEFELVHRRVDQRSVAEARFHDREKGIGYLRLAVFGSRCASEVEAALDTLEDGGMKSLLLDLRGNGGGELGETVKILGLFLPPETTVVTTRGREGEAAEPLKTPARQRRKRGYPLVVLIDRMSASASELTAGALQDLNRAKVVGEVSYGKGSVQNIIPMGGGTALRLTIATYHTPSGNTPHLKGIQPDHAVEIIDETRENVILRARLDTLDPERRKALEEWADPVIEAAVEALAARSD